MPRLRLLTALFVLLVFSATVYTSCIKDQCSRVACYNQGVCVQGVCSCPYLYEGPSCEDRWIDKFSGRWNANETFARDTTGTRRIYDLDISGNADSFYITGLADTLGALQCKRDTRLKFTFRAEQRPDSFVTIKLGRGTISSDGNTVSGLYIFNYKNYSDTANKKDTTITVNFAWRR
ncbi:MAG: hypothetical protein EOP56_05280 [Sphingobacteriales bacterium]|nr:MAG: hypothetical protein EOP56_05280 [Sphingobacteriales bacterium]